jgi:hypothetical protein
MAIPKYTVAELRRVIEMNLAKGQVDIELGNEHFARAVDAALKALARWFPMHGYQVLPVFPGGNKYKLTAQNVLGVLNVEFFIAGPRFEEAPYYTRWVDRSIELADMKDTQRVFGDTPEWHQMKEVNQTTGDEETWIYTSFTRSTFMDTFARLPSHICAMFAWCIEPTDDINVGVNRIAYDLRQWVEDYATAKARTILGDSRGKFGGVPGDTDGSVLPNDGDRQVQRGERDMARLMEDLNNRRRQAPILWD